jgi:hypothetical protein
MSLSGRTISALKRAGITNPTTKTIGDLLRTPGIGTKAMTEIADRTYANPYAYRDEPWPELVDEPKPAPPKRCSHRVLLSDHCSKCAADIGLRT